MTNEIINKVLEYLQENGIKAGVATIYNGGQQTTAIVIEKR